MMKSKELSLLYIKNEPAFGQFLNQHDVSVDDIGSEQEVNNFGIKTNVMEIAIDIRWDVFQKEGGLTLISSNIQTIDKENAGNNSIVKRYGKRTFDRIRGMCWSLKIDGESKR